MKIIPLLALALLTQIASAEPVVLFDGRQPLPQIQPEPAIAETVKAEVRLRSQQPFLKKRLEHLVGKDFDEQFEIRGSARGAFTTPKTDQTAVLYRYSYTNGVVVLQEGKVVAHYSGDPGDYALYTAIAAAPDVRQNGLSEMILFRNVEDGADHYAYLFDGGAYLGAATVYTTNQQPGDEPLPAKRLQEVAYQLEAWPGREPQLIRRFYQRFKGQWVPLKRPPAFKLDTGYQAKLTRIDQTR